MEVANYSPGETSTTINFYRRMLKKYCVLSQREMPNSTLPAIALFIIVSPASALAVSFAYHDHDISIMISHFGALGPSHGQFMPWSLHYLKGVIICSFETLLHLALSLSASAAHLI